MKNVFMWLLLLQVLTSKTRNIMQSTRYLFTSGVKEIIIEAWVWFEEVCLDATWRFYCHLRAIL